MPGHARMERTGSSQCHDQTSNPSEDSTSCRGKTNNIAGSKKKQSKHMSKLYLIKNEFMALDAHSKSPKITFMDRQRTLPGYSAVPPPSLSSEYPHPDVLCPPPFLQSLLFSLLLFSPISPPFSSSASHYLLPATRPIWSLPTIISSRPRAL